MKLWGNIERHRDSSLLNTIKKERQTNIILFRKKINYHMQEKNILKRYKRD